MYDGTPCIEGSESNRTNSGYSRCNVKRFGIKINLRHRLAWIDHHGCLPPADRPLILHHCDNPPCINPLHLYAGTHADNTRDLDLRGRRGARLPGMGPRGEQHGNAKLTDDIVRRARVRWAGGASIKSLAREYGVDHVPMRRALHGSTWKHVL